VPRGSAARRIGPYAVVDAVLQLDQRVRQRLVGFLHRAVRAHLHLVEPREQLLAQLACSCSVWRSSASTKLRSSV
jgi:hypothetical protein